PAPRFAGRGGRRNGRGGKAHSSRAQSAAFLCRVYTVGTRRGPRRSPAGNTRRFGARGPELPAGRDTRRVMRRHGDAMSVESEIRATKDEAALPVQALSTRPPHIACPSPLRAWCYLVLLSWQRQARVRQMVWIAIALLGFSVVLVGLNTLTGRWGMSHWRGPRSPGESWQDWSKRPTYREWSENLTALRATASVPPVPIDAVTSAYAAVLSRSDFLVFSRVVVFSVFLSFLLPLWSLSFATESFGGEREGSSMLWLLTRPLPRPA